MKKLSIFFAAGCLGALANSIAVWLFGYLGITSSFGVSIAPSLSPNWLYPRIVWGGIWGLLFILPILQSNEANSINIGVKFKVEFVIVTFGKSGVS